MLAVSLILKVAIPPLSLPQDNIGSSSPIPLFVYVTIYSCNQVFKTVNKTVPIQEA